MKARFHSYLQELFSSTYLQLPLRLVALKQVEGIVVVACYEAKNCLVWADLTDEVLWGWHGLLIHLETP